MYKYCFLYFTLLLVSAAGCRKTNLELQPEPTITLEKTNYVKTHPVNVISMGFPGYTTGALQSKVDAVLTAKPDLIILMVGINDVSAMKQETYKADLGALIDLLRNDNSIDIMILSPPTSVLRGYDSFILAVKALGSDIASVCTEKKCFYVDVNKVFTENESATLPLFYGDNVHPTAIGYQLLANTVLKAYVENKLSKYNIVCFGDSLTFGALVKGAGTIEGETYPAQLYKLMN